MIFSFDPCRVAPCRHVTTIPSPQLLLFLTLANRDARKSFRMCSYKNCRVTSFRPNIFLSASGSSTFRPSNVQTIQTSLFPLPPCFLTSLHPYLTIASSSRPCRDQRWVFLALQTFNLQLSTSGLPVPLSPLTATLMDLPASVANKRLTV